MFVTKMLLTIELRFRCDLKVYKFEKAHLLSNDQSRDMAFESFYYAEKERLK